MRNRAILVVVSFVLCALAIILVQRGATHADNCPATGQTCSDLMVTIFGPEDAPLGAEVEYDIVAQNNGPDATADATLTQILPAGAILISASPTQGSCDNAPGGVLTCDLGALGYPDTVTVVVTAYLTVPGPNPSTVRVVGTSVDPLPGNNVDSTSVSLGGSCFIGPSRIGANIAAYAHYQLACFTPPPSPPPSPPASPTTAPPPQPNSCKQGTASCLPPLDLVFFTTPTPTPPPSPPLNNVGPGCFQIITPPWLAPNTPFTPLLFVSDPDALDIVTRPAPDAWQRMGSSGIAGAPDAAQLGTVIYAKQNPPAEPPTIGPNQELWICLSRPASILSSGPAVPLAR